MSRPAEQPPTGPALPDRLAADLARLYRAEVAVPSALDEAILRDARAGFARRWRFRRVLRIGGAAAAAAAVAAVVLLSVWVQHRPARPVPVVARASVKGDVNGDGRVDVLDAFLVARAVDRHQPTQPTWDLTGDGVVDRADADRIAALAVQVSGPATSAGGRAIQ